MREKTFWPYGIVLAILAIVLACIATIIFASNYPVYQDNFYFDTYQNVDENYNEIQKSQALFDMKYSLKPQLRALNINNKKLIYPIKAGKENIFRIKISKKNPKASLKVQALLSRPHTTADDKGINASFENGDLVLKIKPKQKGLWQLLIKIEDAKSTGFFKYDLKAS